MINFAIRYYYIKYEKSNIASTVADVADKFQLELISQNIPPDFLEHNDCIYMYQHSLNKMTIVAAAIESENSSNKSAWEKLKRIDNEFKDKDISGKMTVFFNNCSLEELFNKDEVVVSLVDDDLEGPIKGALSLLSWNSESCESNFCYAALEEAVASQMLSNDMPYLFGKLIHLQKLSRKLTDGNTKLQCEKSEFEKQLINILNSKITLSDENINTDELEKDIEWLAVSFAKMVAYQNVNRDGIRKLNTRLNLLENNIKQDSNLINYLNIFENMTDSLHEVLSDLESTDEELSLLREEYKAAIEVIQSRIQVINERTNRSTQEQIRKLLEVNSEMQKKGIVYQYAAAMIEFIVLAYYSHTLWTHLAHTAYTIIPSWIQFIVVLLFSGNTVLVTHLAAEYIQGEKHLYKIMSAAVVSLAAIIVLIMFGSAFAEINGMHL